MVGSEGPRRHIAVVDNRTTGRQDSLSMTELLFARLRHLRVPFENYRHDAAAELLEDARKGRVAGIILSGSSTMLDGEVAFDAVSCALAALTTDLPLLGICFGSQLLCAVHGIPLVRLPSQLCEWLPLSPKSHSKVISKGHSKGHSKGFFCINLVPASKPPRFWRSTSLVPVQHAVWIRVRMVAAFKHVDKPWYGCMYHPEKDDDDGILSTFCNCCLEKCEKNDRVQ